MGCRPCLAGLHEGSVTLRVWPCSVDPEVPAVPLQRPPSRPCALRKTQALLSSPQCRTSGEYQGQGEPGLQLQHGGVWGPCRVGWVASSSPSYSPAQARSRAGPGWGSGVPKGWRGWQEPEIFLANVPQHRRGRGGPGRGRARSRLQQQAAGEWREDGCWV